MYEGAAAEIQKLNSSVAIHLADLPGFGAASYQEQWTFAEAMQALHDELHRSGITMPIIGGTSMGGYAVFAYYRLFPQHVRGLILSNTKASADSDEAKAAREAFALDIEKRGLHAVYEKLMDKMISVTSRRRTPQLMAKLHDWIAASEPPAFAAAQRAMAVRDDSTELLAQIDAPTLIVAGGDDTIIPLEESRNMREIRNSRLAIIPDTAHLPAVESPASWANEVVNFLTTLEGSPL